VMKNPTPAAIQPSHSSFGWISRNAFGAEPPEMWPRPNSRIIIGMPAVASATTYATRKAPQPYFAQMYGKRIRFPSPIAEPIAASTKAVRLVQ